MFSANLFDVHIDATLVDPTWQSQSRARKVVREHNHLSRYGTMTIDDLRVLPISAS